MSSEFALFEGLISTEDGEPVEVTRIGDTLIYVVPDAGFMRHIDSAEIDRQVLRILRDQLEPHRDVAVEAAMKMIGRDDLFTKAMIDASIDNMEQLLKRLAGDDRIQGNCELPRSSSPGGAAKTDRPWRITAGENG